jgi:hypothetical protein
MKITNKYNLPESIFQAVAGQVYPPRPDRFSVTDLINPPLMRQLKLQHWNSLEEDCSERLWSLLGQAIHAVLEKTVIDETLQEEKIVQEFQGVKISGRIDLYHGVTKTIEDYKVTSVYSFLLGEKIEWQQQLNIYKWLFEHTGFEVQALKIHAILRDWKATEAQKNNDYPPIPFITLNIPVWSNENIESFIIERLKAHQEGKVCTNEERWYRGEKWAVKKSGNKTAMKVFETEEKALKFKEEYSKQYPRVQLEIEYRHGQYLRCELYCPVRTHCPVKGGVQ